MAASKLRVVPIQLLWLHCTIKWRLRLKDNIFVLMALGRQMTFQQMCSPKIDSYAFHKRISPKKVPRFMASDERSNFLNLLTCDQNRVSDDVIDKDVKTAWSWCVYFEFVFNFWVCVCANIWKITHAHYQKQYLFTESLVSDGQQWKQAFMASLSQCDLISLEALKSVLGFTFSSRQCS